ncbi:MAG: DMT family transporter [Pseudomonadota bacterium]|nr:DMT family transporter [Pseudomonadota bacterium]MEC8295490.1 DMT family transporter [Pseudomonadota bacterium]
MRLFLLVALTMAAFAANSLLNRAGIVQAGADALGFAVVRLLAGAGVLGLLVLLRPRTVLWLQPSRVFGVASLLLYLFGFSLAYQALDAGAGALVLFGMVQVTMFLGALALREVIPVTRWLGVGVAMTGLCWLLWPGEGAQLSSGAAGMMALAGVGWGVYSLIGRGAQDPLGDTAANFVLAVPFGMVTLIWADWHMSTPALVLAITSGAVTSGLGYALWYALLPQLGAGRAAVAQLSVPVLAILGGALVLAEWPDVEFLLATGVVLLGVALAAKRG